MWNKSARLFVQKLWRRSRPQKSIMLGSWPSGDNGWRDVDGADHRLTLGNLFLFPLTHVFLTELRSQEVIISSPGTSKELKLILSLISCYSRHNGSLSPPCDNTAWPIQYGSITVTEASCSWLAQNQPLFKESSSWFIEPDKAMHDSQWEPIPELGKLRQGDGWKLQVIWSDLVRLCPKTKQNYPPKSPV